VDLALHHSTVQGGTQRDCGDPERGSTGTFCNFGDELVFWKESAGVSGSDSKTPEHLLFPSSVVPF